MERLSLLAALMCGLLLSGVACGGGGGDDDPGTSNGGTAGGPEPALSGPASRYVPALEELPGNFSVYPPETFALGQATWSLTGPFNPVEGKQLVQEWRYADGFKVQYDPDGKLAGVLEGRYYVNIETHLFETIEGARSAFDAFDEQLRSASGARVLNPPKLGNESTASEIIDGVVGTSDTVAIAHRFIFRRGNLVAVVQTYGAEPYMSVNFARDVAVLIDERALGNRPPVEPTPIQPAGQGGG